MQNFLQQAFPKVIWFVIINLLLLTIARVILYYLANLHVEDLEQGVSFDIYLMGFRFDVKYTASALLLFILLPAPILCCLAQKFNHSYSQFILGFTLCITLILCIINSGYFILLNNVIDAQIFGFITDDTVAIIYTIIQNPRLVVIGLIGICLLVFIIVVYGRLTKNTVILPSSNDVVIEQKRTQYWLVWLFLLTITSLLARGSLGLFPLSQFTSSISGLAIVNTVALNPYQYLKIAITNHQETSSFVYDTKKFLQQNNLNSFAHLLKLANYQVGVKEFDTNKSHNVDSVKTLLAKTPAITSVDQKVKLYNVIFVLMEGWSSHIASTHTDNNPVLGEFERHRFEDNFFLNVFSNGTWTNTSLESLLVNSPISPLSQSVAVSVEFNTSNILPFKRKGYDTSFIYGGYSSWRDHSYFWPQQGFNRYIGRKDIERQLGANGDNPWGVPDEDVFVFLKKKILKHQTDNPTQPFFHFVLTTNNHLPVHVPDNYQTPNLDINALSVAGDKQEKLQSLHGFHYTTNEFGKFMDWLKQSASKDNTIVIATGDHVVKGFFSYNLMDEFNRFAVPLYIYLPTNNPYYEQLQRVREDISASHEDIFPTLFHLALPDATYFNFGTPLFFKKINYSYGWIDNGKFLFKEGVANNKTKSIHLWLDKAKGLVEPQPTELSTWHRKVMARQEYIQNIKRYLITANAIQNKKSK